MHTMKKLTGIILAVVMAMLLTTAAFAATVTVPTEGILKDHTFTAYQIFTGRLEGTTLSDIQWGTELIPKISLLL